ncbi:Retrovirus-related Pol polyprotein from type-1 retrotransposable element R2 [Frankliniella fusca]|uniref:Retrovirus-related Pol polyprotein from type-1 retrotransposable element R2 n=1 Tax=Frankliniella fusca TaxID=407009 RepID=A0AAE1LB68_9NEOP|nr:Retrovirus-related Pol polyprotein from type-1 retrotransposable element R2 [Frankliniella fusca]
MRITVSRQELITILREKVGQSRDIQRNHLQDTWLDTLQRRVGKDLSDKEVKEAPPKTEKLGGRPTLPFTKSSARTQRTKAQKLGKDHCVEELLKSAETLLRKAGNEAAAKLINLLMINPERSSEIWQNINNPTPAIKKMAPEQAVSLIIDADLSKNQYNLIRTTAKTHNANIFPSNRKVQEQKKKSLPPPESVQITEKSAEVDLQTLVDMDAKKIVDLLEREGKTISNFDGLFVLTHKWGTDGSGDHSLHRHNTGSEISVERSILLTAQVPLQLKFVPNDSVLAKKGFGQEYRDAAHCAPRQLRGRDDPVRGRLGVPPRGRKETTYADSTQHLRSQGWEVTVDAFIVGSLGSWDPANWGVLNLLRLGDWDYNITLARLCVSDCIKWSRDIYTEHVTGGSPSPSPRTPPARTSRQRGAALQARQAIANSELLTPPDVPPPLRRTPGANRRQPPSTPEHLRDEVNPFLSPSQSEDTAPRLSKWQENLLR